MLVAEFCELQRDNFPTPFYDSLPTGCPHCGFPMEISETLTQLHCSNPRCLSKIVRRMSAMCSFLGIKDFGEARIKDFVETNDCFNPLGLFAYSPEEDGALGENISMELSEKIYAQVQEKKRMTLAEYVRYANLPHVQTSSSLIFGDFDTLADAYSAIENGDIEFIQEKLGTSGDVRAYSIYISLMEFKEDLMMFEDDVEIIPVNKADTYAFKAVVSDEVGGGFKTKAEFYAACNSLRDDVHIEFLSSATKSIDFLIWAGADGTPAKYTNKVEKVNKWNYDAGIKIKAGGTAKVIPIMTAGQFIEYLKSL